MPPFAPDEEKTQPEIFRARMRRLMAERVLAYDPADIAVLIQMRTEAISAGRRGSAWHRYSEHAARFVENLLKE